MFAQKCNISNQSYEPYIILTTFYHIVILGYLLGRPRYALGTMELTQIEHLQENN